MLLNGLTKGVLMLVLGAIFTWVLIAGFESRAREQVSTSSQTAPSTAHAPGKRGAFEWQF